MTFQLDTTGHVQGWVPPHGDRHGYDGPNRISWSDLDAFTQGYVEAMLRDRYLRDKIGGAIATLRTPDLDVEPHAFRDLAPETLARIIADCERTESEPTTGEMRAEGAAFWKLRNACDYVGFPPLTVQLGEDGKVRFG